MKYLKLLLTALAVSNIAIAQKLPNVQTASLRAPANIKVDGKATEWGDKFQAYNKATDVFYNVANDDNKLYLTLQTSDEYIIKKILWGRATFSINKLAKKQDANAITITYPVIDRKDRPAINFKEMPKIIDGNKTSVAQADSFMNLSNKRLTEKAKMIKVTGINTLDTLISVYNTDGIKTAIGFDNKMTYTYELAINLKALGLNAKNEDKFYYNLTLNQLPLDDMPGVNITRAPNGEITSVVIEKSQANAGTNVYGYTTDFWGEYALAK